MVCYRSFQAGNTIVLECRTLQVSGLVQGVGFRPFVYGLAGHLGLTGRVWNNAAGAMVEVEGEADLLDRFCDRLVEDAPRPVLIEQIQSGFSQLKGYAGFAIAASDRQTPGTAVVSSDLAPCQNCLRDLHNPRDRHHDYPFLTCTNCGPRFTIVTATPYDRERTTMADFSLCRACRSEYHHPSDRRFHAQSIACPCCGPRLTVLSTAGSPMEADDPLAFTLQALHAGRIVAIKGLGGYHLACDAENQDAVRELRRRKHRDAKALAMMVADVEEARSYCDIGPAEQELLTSPQRPIVLLRKHPGIGLEDVAPRNDCFGIMLPNTPLHHLLLERFGGPLIMTSGNRSDEPMAFLDQDAIGRLSDIADLFLSHNRPIHTRCDDSVTRVVLGEPLPIRRSRGYAPLPIVLAHPAPCPILACGGHLKNVFCLVDGDRAFLSQHHGDLDDLESYRAFVEGIDRFQTLFRIAPQAVAYDLHPDYRSTRYALSLQHLRCIPVQHHHAHIAACLADNRAEGRVIGVAFDGTGYGTDGTLWGGEFLLADHAGFERAAHLEPLALPGGEMAIRHPWRIAAGLLLDRYGDGMDSLKLDFIERLDGREWPVIRAMLLKRFNTPYTSSAGRLFDAVAALIGAGHTVHYEAQAAIALEALAGRERSKDCYPSQVIAGRDGPLIVSTGGIVQGVIDDLVQGRSPASIASRFHSSMAQLIHGTCLRLRSCSGLGRVALSGGVFQNARLLAETVELLEASGFLVYRHRQAPTNDGGLALGQATVAAAILRNAQDQAQGDVTGAYSTVPSTSVC